MSNGYQQRGTMPNLNMDIQQTLNRLNNNWEKIKPSTEYKDKFYQSLLETWILSDQLVQKINSNGREATE